MSSRFDKMIKDFIDTIKENKKTIGPYDTVATVVRIENDIVFVHIPGGIDETPVSKTVDCKIGDTVQVRVGGGRAWITGNATSPPTDDTRAIKASGEATKFITDLSNGVFVHREGDEKNGVQITDKVDIVRNGYTSASYGEETLFYVPKTKRVAGRIGAGGMDIIRGNIGGWEINSDSISREIAYGSVTSTVALDNTGLNFDNGGARIYADDSGDMFLEADAIEFYVGENSLTYILAYDAGLHVVNATSECQVRCISDAGWIYMYSQGQNSLGNRGMYGKNSSGVEHAIIDIGQDNICYFRGFADSGSDLKIKDVITDYDWKIDEFIRGLKPIAYKRKYEDGSTGDRIRMGFGAQDIAELSHRLYDEDLSLYRARIVDETKNGSERESEYHGEDIDDNKLEWTLIYSELIAPMVLEMQKLMDRVDKLENENFQLLHRLEQLKN